MKNILLDTLTGRAEFSHRKNTRNKIRRTFSDENGREKKEGNRGTRERDYISHSIHEVEHQAGERTL